MQPLYTFSLMGLLLRVDMPEIKLVSLAFKYLPDDTTQGSHCNRCLARSTTCLTCSPYCHVEIMLTMACPGVERCAMCSSDQSRDFHTLTYTVTENSGEVHALWDRPYLNYWYFAHALPKDKSTGDRCKQFLNSILGQPFDWLNIYVGKTLCCCLPDLLQTGCAYNETHNYTGTRSRWTCSSMVLACLQFTGLGPGIAPTRSTPAQIMRLLQRAPEWVCSQQRPPRMKSDMNTLKSTGLTDVMQLCARSRAQPTNTIHPPFANPSRYQVIDVRHV